MSNLFEAFTKYLIFADIAARLNRTEKKVDKILKYDDSDKRPTETDKAVKKYITGGERYRSLPMPIKVEKNTFAFLPTYDLRDVVRDFN